ncbi:MAG TPA: hypothetical protein VFG12_02580 [Rhodopila sp.]|nr:hypothetical protein [Rhodopila sp.]
MQNHPGIRLLSRPLFLLLVVVPNLLAVTYYGFVASPVFMSTASISVSNPSANASSLVSILSGTSSDDSMEGAYILQEYLVSWEAFSKASHALNLAGAWQDGDFASRYGGLTTFWQQDDTALWHYYQSHVTISVDPKSGIVVIYVYGYRPEFAVTLSKWLLNEATQHMNEMNQRQERDFIASAEQKQAALSLTLKRDEAAIAGYRAQIGVYDPQQKYLSELSLANGLALKLADLQSQYQTVARATPDNPMARNLDTAISVMKQRMDDTQQLYPRLARDAETYENLVIVRDADAKLLEQADLAVQQAQQKASQNRYYFGAISDPSLPQTPELPHRLEYIAGVLLASVVIWGLLR